MADDKKESFGQAERRKYSEKLVEVIKENERRKEQRQFQEELTKRIQLARDGRYSYERKDLRTATINYKRFLFITAKSMGVEVKDMHPRLFEEKVRISESLLITAIVFDLAKIFDRVKGGQAERLLYLRLLVLFTNNMPFQFFIAENISKFLKYTPNIINKNEFKAAHKAIRKGGWCFIASVCFGEESPEVETFRRFRNEVLWRTPGGGLLVDAYYATSPSIANWLAKHPPARAKARRALLKISELIVRYGQNET
jgi:hypothetical protein